MHIRRAAYVPFALTLSAPTPLDAMAGPVQFKPRQKRIIRRVARRERIPPRVLQGLTFVETGNDPGAVSPAGARGATQFMPGTGETYGVRYSGKGSYRSQIDAAARYLNDLGYQRDPRGALAKYNGGPGNPQYGYADKVLSAAQRFRGDLSDVDAGGGGGKRARFVEVPGVDNSAAREQVAARTLGGAWGQGRLASPGELAGLSAELAPLGDTPARVELRGGGRGSDRQTRAGDGSSVMGMLRKAVAWDRATAPYLWGGGHGATAKPGQPVDCSGFVSAVLGLKTPQVSGNLAGWGKPGRGRNVTVYANSGHVLMSIRDPRSGKWRWFATSRSNPGDGAGEIAPPSASYLASFAARHPG
jgi:hypothetical protein